MGTGISAMLNASLPLRSSTMSAPTFSTFRRDSRGHSRACWAAMSLADGRRDLFNATIASCRRAIVSPLELVPRGFDRVASRGATELDAPAQHDRRSVLGRLHAQRLGERRDEAVVLRPPPLAAPPVVRGQPAHRCV